MGSKENTTLKIALKLKPKLVFKLCFTAVNYKLVSGQPFQRFTQRGKRSIRSIRKVWLSIGFVRLHKV